MVDPCKTSKLDDFTVSDMLVSVKGAFDVQTLVDPTDLVSRTYGNLDGNSYCGAREFEISVLPASIYSNFLGYEPGFNTLTLGTNDDADVNVYELDLRAYLVNYPEVELIKRFRVEVFWCQVTGLTPKPIIA